jgi:hypothetical protein
MSEHPTETERSQSGGGTEEQKPSPDQYPSGGVGSGDETAGEGTNGGDRTGRERESAKPPRGDQGDPSDT